MNYHTGKWLKKQWLFAGKGGRPGDGQALLY
jgi:hypothetical protein